MLVSSTWTIKYRRILLTVLLEPVEPSSILSGRITVHRRCVVPFKVVLQLKLNAEDGEQELIHFRQEQEAGDGGKTRCTGSMYKLTSPDVSTLNMAKAKQEAAEEVFVIIRMVLAWKAPPIYTL
ncbi:hypothetical protein AAG570_001319 [Ranatra chinensis]|uniref:Uncharacterized protein n=1 Tax=Ranatra chinensis TaxID=642074 RepID=A0ABD0YBH8_9HEMI